MEGSGEGSIKMDSQVPGVSDQVFVGCCSLWVQFCACGMWVSGRLFTCQCCVGGSKDGAGAQEPRASSGRACVTALRPQVVTLPREERFF